DVITALEKIGGLSRVRLSSIEAGDVSDRLIRKMAQSDAACQQTAKLCRHLHIPVQSGDDEILKKMNRQYTSNVYLKLIKKIRNKIPQIAISTDVLVGFPGEKEENFQNTVKLRLKIFAFSEKSIMFVMKL
ncbi:MAG: radical SAM protein, partial [Ferruginibacter sp.]